jgi:hypothetical protein
MTNGRRGLADCEESISDNNLRKILVLPFLGIKGIAEQRFSKYVSPHTAVARAVGMCSEISLLRENRSKFMKFIFLFCVFQVPQMYCICYCYVIILLEISLLHPLVKPNKQPATPKRIRW